MNDPSNRIKFQNQNIPILSNMRMFNTGTNQNFQGTGYNIGMPITSPQIGIGSNYDYNLGLGGIYNNQYGSNSNLQFNTSGPLYNSATNINNNFGVIGNFNTQYGVPFTMGASIPDFTNRSANSISQPGVVNNINAVNNSYAMQNNLMLGQMLQQNENLSNSILAQINQLNLDRLQRLKIEEEASQKQTEDEKEFKRRFEEEWKKFLLSKEEMAMIKPIGENIRVNKSEYFYDRDRYFFEELIQQPLKTEGCLGMRLVKNLDKSKLYKADDAEGKEKISTFNYNNNKTEKQNDFLEKMSMDGIYLDYVKNTIYSYNLQKVEQRALRENKLDWFKFNGDLRLENDIFDDVVTVPADISLSSNDRFKTHYVRHSMCTRSTGKKFKVFKLKIFLSKLIFTSHPLYIEEDILCAELKEHYNDYYRQVNMMNIPYHREKIFTISRQLDEYSKRKETSDAINLEIKYMKIFVEESVKFLENEKRILNQKANLLYNKWKELKKLRENQKFQSTNFKISVLRFPTNSNENPNIFDYAFILSNSEPTQDNKILPRVEIQRRQNIMKLKCYLKIFINNIFVADTKKYPLLWPNFEINMNDLLQVNVFSRPTKIELELYIGNFTFKKVGRFEIEPPGVFSNSVTSSSTLLEEIEFSSQSDNKNFENKQEGENKLIHSNTLNLMKDSLQVNKEENEKLLDIPPGEKKPNNKSNKNAPIHVEKIYKGKILLKLEWEGVGPDMPPTKMEDKINLIKKQKASKEQTSIMNRYDFPFDINDPRNVIYFEKMKKLKTEILLKYLNKEYMLPFYDVKSLRHYLLVKRQEKSSLKKLKIPLLETEIEKSSEIRKVLREIDNVPEETQEEQEKRIKSQLEKLNKMYGNNVLNEEEYMIMLTKKIKTMKKDIVNKLQMSYFQIISEFFYSPDIKLGIRDFCFDVISPARKLAPRKKRNTAAKLETIKEIKITVHIVKGYNMPIRNESIPASIRDQIKSHAIGQVYKSGAGSNLGVMTNQLLKREMRNKGLENIMMEMQNQNMNSGAFGNPNTNTGNNSIVGGININVNDMNNPFGIKGMIPGMGYDIPITGTSQMSGINPNLQNMMFNPNQPNLLYKNVPNPIYNQVMIPPKIRNYEGDILEMIEILKGVEKIVESFIQVNMNYYDQECEMRTESIDGLHPDYNSKMRFTIKPKNGESCFTREELSKCQGSFYFTLYDELRTEQKIQEKDSNTYIYKYEKQYLGSFQIPFTTIFQNASLLETVCKINIPPSVFGYYSDVSSTYDILQHKEQDLRKEEGAKQLENQDGSKSTLRLTDSKFTYYM